MFITGATAPLSDTKAPGTEIALAASTSPAPKLAMGWGGIVTKLTPQPNSRQIKL